MKEIGRKINEAKQCGRFMVAVFQVKDGQVVLDRFTNEFPIEDRKTAVKLLQDDLAKIGQPAPIGGKFA